MAQYRRVIHWFRRDLRLTDNTALYQARQVSEEIIPVYILSEWQGHHPWTGPGRQQFLCGCLESLANNIEAAGGRLVFRSGPALETLEALVRETSADAIFLNRDPDPFGRAIEKRLLQVCRSLGIALHDFKDVTLHEPSEVLTQSGTPFRVYTPFSRVWMSLPKPAPLPHIQSFPPSETLQKVKSLPQPTLTHWGLTLPDLCLPQPGENAARNRLKKAEESAIITRYAENRNFPALDATSGLGPDFRYGTLSPREVFSRAQQLYEQTTSTTERESIFTFQKQLAWREFFFSILGHFPEVLETEFNSAWRGLHWDDPSASNRFESWKLGKTGFPIVDAGMRQLLCTGTMHNRLRMITAMFLTKDLHLDWRLGEAHFIRHLLDGEIANNNGGWQWSAGTGADAAPYFRIQNPWTQTERHDPEGKYIKKWIPELAQVDPRRFHKPPQPLDPLAPDYPIPIVLHERERDITLERFHRHKEKKPV